MKKPGGETTYPCSSSPSVVIIPLLKSTFEFHLLCKVQGREIENAKDFFHGVLPERLQF
jgi:hypothetical protein